MLCSIGLALNDKLFLEHSTSFTEHHTIGPNAFWLNPLVNTLKIIHFGMCPMFVTTANGKPKKIQKRTEQQTARRSFQQYAKRTFKANSKYTSQVCCHCNGNYSGRHEQSFYKHVDNCARAEMSMTKTSFEQIMHDHTAEDQYQYKAGASYMRSLLAHSSIPDLAKKRKHVELDTTEEVTEFNAFQFDSCPPCQWSEEEHQQQEEQEEETGYVVAAGGDLEEDTTEHDTDEDSLDDPDLPIKFRQSARMYKQRKEKMPSNERKENAQKREPKKGEDLSASQIALIDLGEILSRHKCDKGLFNDIVDWARHWSNLKPDIWKSNGKSNEWTRETILKSLAAEFNAHDLKPNSKTVRLSDNRIVSVPVIDFEAVVRSLLDDPEINNQRNLMKGIDPETWRCKVSAQEHETDHHAIIGDKDSGYIYRMAMDVHVPAADSCNASEVRPLPIILHIDKAHYDLHGHLAVTPIGVTLGMWDIDTQQKTRAWRQMATVPNLSAKKGKNKKKKKRSGEFSIQDHHDVLKAAFSSFKHYYDDGGLLWKDPNGKLITLKPYIQFIIGDTMGNNELCGHYLSNFANCLTKDCKCNSADLVLVDPPKCSAMSWEELEGCKNSNGTFDHHKVFDKYYDKGLISLRDLSEIKGDQDYQQELSYYDVDNVFDHLPLGDPYQGVVGITPQEMLHVMEAGIYERILFAIRDVMGTNKKNSADKESVDKLFEDMKLFIERNSERDVIRMSNRRGFFNLSMVNASERHGNFFGLVMVMQTTVGRSIMKPLFEKKGIHYDSMLETCLLVLSWDQFLQDFNERFQMEDAKSATLAMMQRIQDHFPRERKKKTKEEDGSHGWHIVKYHIMSMMTGLNLKFGCAKVTHGSAGEKNHKWFVKRMAMMTQGRLDSFAVQVATNYYECELFKLAYRNVKQLCVITKKHDYENVETTDERQCYLDIEDALEILPEHLTLNSGVEGRGACNLQIKIDARGRKTCTFRWHDSNKNHLQDIFSPHPHLIHGLGESSLAYCKKLGITSKRKFDVKMFTEAKVTCQSGRPYLFRCSPSMNNSEWYDWAMFRDPSSENEYGQGSFLGRILGFVQFLGKGSLTYNHVQIQRKTADTIKELSDDTMYVVVHAETGYTKYDHLQKTFIKRIQLEDNNGIWILPAKASILGPALVIPDMEDLSNASSTDFIAVMGRHKWGSYFHGYSKKLRHVSETGNSYESDNDEDMQDKWHFDF